MGHYRDGDHKVDVLQLTANVLRPPLDLSVRFHKKGFGIRSPDAFHRRQNLLYLPGPEIPVVRSEDIGAIRKCYILLEALETKYPEIKRAFLMLNDLRDLPWRSDCETLGLFSIVEILVTHRPRSSDAGDSITHQVSTKLPLLMNCFAPPIDPSPRFGQSKPATIWNKLYDYRSNLAHGSELDFASKLIVLGHAENVRGFLREITAALLRHSLVEPELLRDLRAC